MLGRTRRVIEPRHGSRIYRRSGALAVSAAALILAFAGQAAAQGTPAPKPPATGEKYNPDTSEFRTKPPEDWWRGGETEEQHGLTPVSSPPTPASEADLKALIQRVKLPQGFTMSVYQQGVQDARQMALGAKGTLFVGAFEIGKVRAITKDHQVKTILTGQNMPTGIGFKDGSLYVIEITKISRYDNIEDNLDNPPKPVIVYQDMPNYPPHGWKYFGLGPDNKLYVAFGPPCNVCNLPFTNFGYRRINLDGSHAEPVVWGIRNSVGMDFDPRTGDLWFSENSRDWLGDDKPSDRLGHVKLTHGAIIEVPNYGYPYCHPGKIPDPKYGEGEDCSKYAQGALDLGPHMAPLGMKFYTGKQFPAEYQNNIFIAEHGSWNRHTKNGYRIVRVVANTDGTVTKNEVFADGFADAAANQVYGRPDDILNMPDGSLLVADDYAGAVYQIAYKQ
jgi:glucose/arabinose dehydrogenase